MIRVCPYMYIQYFSSFHNFLLLSFFSCEKFRLKVGDSCNLPDNGLPTHTFKFFPIRVNMGQFSWASRGSKIPLAAILTGWPQSYEEI